MRASPDEGSGTHRIGRRRTCVRRHGAVTLGAARSLMYVLQADSCRRGGQGDENFGMRVMMRAHEEGRDSMRRYTELDRRCRIGDD